MYRVVLVDDEALVKLGLRAILDWNEAGFEIIGEASGGREGCEMILDLRPDLVITDIIMPEMDGLQMIEEVRKHMEMPAFVVLSSYDQFDLVKNAMKLGAKDYLLKLSINEEFLKEMLAVIKGELDEQKTKEGSLSPVHSNWEKEELRRVCFEQLLMGKQPDASLVGLGISMEEESFCVFCVRPQISEMLESKNSSECKVYLETLRTLLEEIANAFCKSYCILWDRIFVLVLSVEHEKEFESFVSEMEAAMLHSLKEYGNVTAKIGRSGIVKGGESISAALEQARRRTVQKSAEGGNDNRIVNAAKRYINEHIYETIGLKDIASALFISSSYLSATFSKYETVGLSNYINQEKIKVAQRLLIEERMKIYEVSFKLGYENAGYFTKVFKKFVGCSPEQYQSQHRILE